jgi:hypothetical protein
MSGPWFWRVPEGWPAASLLSSRGWQCELRRLEAIEQDIELLEQRIAEKLAPYESEVVRLKQISGVDRDNRALCRPSVFRNDRHCCPSEHYVEWHMPQRLAPMLFDEISFLAWLA